MVRSTINHDVKRSIRQKQVRNATYAHSEWARTREITGTRMRRSILTRFRAKWLSCFCSTCQNSTHSYLMMLDLHNKSFRKKKTTLSRLHTRSLPPTANLRLVVPLWPSLTNFSLCSEDDTSKCVLVTHFLCFSTPNTHTYAHINALALFTAS